MSFVFVYFGGSVCDRLQWKIKEKKKGNRNRRFDRNKKTLNTIIANSRESNLAGVLTILLSVPDSITVWSLNAWQEIVMAEANFSSELGLESADKSARS